MEELGLPDLFTNFDDADYYQDFEKRVLAANTSNFVIEFDANNAKAAVDLDPLDVKKLLGKPRSPNTTTRWINIFAPDQQPDTVRLIAKSYGFTPRLGAIMSAPRKPTSTVPLSNRASAHRFSADRRSLFGGTSRSDGHLADPEKNALSTVSAVDAAATLDLNHYNIINEVWHYCSVDWGSRYLCIGYNSLPNIDSSTNTAALKDDKGAKLNELDPEADFGLKNVPPGKRIWSWLVLCNDGTVISMLEDPFPSSRQRWSEDEKAALGIIRRNLLTVVRQLSAVKNEWRRSNPISILDIRPSMTSNSSSNVKIAESPGALFYYLFDDWYTSYALVAKREQQYAARLQILRQHLFERPRTELIQSLHQAGRQLAVLKRMYESYALIIKRILEKQKQFTKAKMQAHYFRPGSTGNPETDADMEQTLEDFALIDKDTFGAPLMKGTIARFERLLDRINLYALTEIQECLAEKEDLVFLNFNLITLKESSAIEKLTRITILLAKATILFLPVSLMTGYFSTQIQDLQNVYTAKTYWVTFAVIFTLSFLFLLGFGWISGTLEGTVVYQPLGRALIEAGKQIYKPLRSRTHKK